MRCIRALNFDPVITTVLKPAQTLLTSLELACNRYLRTEPDLLSQLSALDGKVIALHLRGMDISLFLSPGTDGIHIHNDYDGQPDTELYGSPTSFIRMGLMDDSSDLMLTREIEIRGDIGLGEQFKYILSHIDFDWEEQLSKVTGDVIAHQLGNAIRQGVNWGKQTADTLISDTGEYLREESRHTPDRDEVESFLSMVDELRSDFDRLEQRVKRLLKSHVEDQPT